MRRLLLLASAAVLLAACGAGAPVATRSVAEPAVPEVPVADAQVDAPPPPPLPPPPQPLEGGSFWSITGAGDISSGFDAADVEATGTAWDAVAPGPDAIAPAPVDRGRSRMRGRSADLPLVDAGPLEAHGDLDPQLIRRYIKRNLPKITYCYEQRLAGDRTLAGTVQTRFFIAPTGTVQGVEATGVDPAVAACIAGVIETIEFPKPRGGGGVQVNYPFQLKPTGG